MKKKVSVIIPTFNRSTCLRNCLDALYREINRNEVAVVVVDDGSDPEEQCRNRTICLDFKAEYLVIANAGSSQARNSGLQISNSEWIAFLDDDVSVNSGWYSALCTAVNSNRPGILGVEGRVVPSGEGVWDREVSNDTGRLYLTCNIIYRKYTLDKIGGFDRSGNFPPCEDHELAARVLELGHIVFCPQLCVTHMPRVVNLITFINRAPHRIRRHLNAEFYFYSLRPLDYNRFRHASSFWGTYRSILFKHVMSSLRRRDIRRLLRNPLQTWALITGLFIEQICAWLLLPGYLRRKIPRPAKAFKKKSNY
ncbi:MAG: glycosyltransferase [Chitinispirillaceae bacterium]|nr:glycosyltransferase [Chitinispirillaceae bacterium]